MKKCITRMPPPIPQIPRLLQVAAYTRVSSGKDNTQMDKELANQFFASPPSSGISRKASKGHEGDEYHAFTLMPLGGFLQ